MECFGQLSNNRIPLTDDLNNILTVTGSVNSSRVNVRTGDNFTKERKYYMTVVLQRKFWAVIIVLFPV